MPEYKLTYFNIRAKAEVTRYLFALADVEYEDVRYEFGDWPAFKPKTPFGQMPLLEYQGRTICQSHAIERFLARKFGFAGTTDWEQARVDMIVQCTEDYLDPLVMFVREDDADKKKEMLKKYLAEQNTPFLDHFDKILKENDGGKHGYFVGSDITLADVAFFHATTGLVSVFGQEIPASWDRWPALKALRDKIESHPRIKAWQAKRPVTIM